MVFSSFTRAFHLIFSSAGELWTLFNLSSPRILLSVPFPFVLCAPSPAVSSSVIDGNIVTAVVAELSTDEEDIKKNSIQVRQCFKCYM
jgi:hypothetical protein